MTILGGPDKKMAQSQRFLVDEKMASRGRKRPEHANVARDLDGTPSRSQSFAGLGVDGDGLRSRQGSMEPPSSMRTRVDAFRGFGQSRVPPGRSRRDRRRLPRLRASRSRRGTPGRVWRRRGARRAALEGRKVSMGCPGPGKRARPRARRSPSYGRTASRSSSKNTGRRG